MNPTANGLTLREFRAADLPTLFAHQQDAEANHMAGFTAEDPHDEGAFIAKMERIMANDEIVKRVIEVGGEVVGNVMGFQMFGEDKGFAHGRGREIRELIMRLDEGDAAK